MNAVAAANRSEPLLPSVFVLLRRPRGTARDDGAQVPQEANMQLSSVRYATRWIRTGQRNEGLTCYDIGVLTAFAGVVPSNCVFTARLRCCERELFPYSSKGQEKNKYRYILIWIAISWHLVSVKSAAMPAQTPMCLSK